MKIFNDKITRQKRKILRKNQTEAEKVLWQLLRDRRFRGLKFFRQYSIGHYIADFYCSEHMLAIEVDGKHHNTKDKIEYDKEREIFFKALNIKTLRVSNQEVLQSQDEVLGKVEKVIFS